MQSILKQSRQEEFSIRFVKVLRDAGYEISATKIAAEFNARYPDHALSVHGVRKWLVGQSIPTQGKLVALAGWLNVTPGLLFNCNAVKIASAENKDQLDGDAGGLLRDLQRLSPIQKILVVELVDILGLSCQAASGKKPTQP